ncbi:MAG TPA: tail fiber domain-containing protein [Pyrinomonadaceae bacterium]
MPRIRVLIVISLITFCAVNSAVAQEIKPIQSASGPAITVAASGDRVRFTAPTSVVQMHLQVYDTGGQLVFDVSAKGNVLDWTLQDGGGTRLISGSYLSVVTVKGLSGRLSQRIGSVSVQEKQVVLERADAAQMTAAQQQEVGPIEENSGLTILQAGETEAVTVLAHDGTAGQLTRSRGALSFRLGDFFSGNDVEQMRLTEEGNLGVGTDNPQAKLDVAGTIRVTKGIEFADGTVQTTGLSGRKDKDGNLVPNVAGAGTTNQVAKWTDNAGTLGDSTITEVGGRVGIGVTNPTYRLVVGPDIGPGLTTSDLTISRGAGQSVSIFAGATGAHGMNFGWDEANQRAFVNAPVQSPITFTHGGLSERMRIATNGNIGVGTTAPGQKLEVAGNVKVSGNGNGFMFSDGTSMTTAGASLGANSFNGNQSVVGDISASGSISGSHGSFSGTLTADAISGGSGSFSGNLTADTSSLFVDANNHRVGVGTGAPANKLSVNGNADFTGNVGVGTPAPLAVLHVLGSQPPPLSSQNGSNAPTVLQIIGGKGGEVTSGEGFSGGTGANVIIQAGSGGDAFSARGLPGVAGSIRLQPGLGGSSRDSGTGPAGNVLISPDGGKVGIGTTAPSHKLEVKGGGFEHNVLITDSDTTATTVDIGNTSTGGQTWRLQSIGSGVAGRVGNFEIFQVNGLNPVTIQPNGQVGIGIGLNAVNAVTIQPNGRVGIGTFNPQDVLDVQGTISFAVLGSAGSTTLCRNASNQIATCSSSLRYKTDLHPFIGGLNVVNSLHPITFRWKADQMLDVGLGAEDVAAVEPLLVTHNASGQVEGVKYDRLSAVFINAFKEQQAQIARQQADVKQQQDQIATLQMANAALNARLRAIEKTLKKNGSVRRRR